MISVWMVSVLKKTFCPAWKNNVAGLKEPVSGKYYSGGGFDLESFRSGVVSGVTC